MFWNKIIANKLRRIDLFFVYRKWYAWKKSVRLFVLGKDWNAWGRKRIEQNIVNGCVIS